MIKSLIKSIAHPSEVRAMLWMIWNGENKTQTGNSSDWGQQTDNRTFCYFALNRVSRSFAAVIQQLPADLEDAICVFYLVLRGLDSVEDDMHISLDKKQRLLVDFYTNLGSGKNYPGIGDTDDYRELMKRFENVDAFYSELPMKYRLVIKDICQKMGKGMAEFTEKDVYSIQDYDKYCHIVAGLVGLGLTDLFATSDYESSSLLNYSNESNSMGLFLQKTNITRDYHEDLLESRLFWPTEIWSKHAEDISNFNKNPEAPFSLNAINDMVTDALKHLPDCIRYMAQLKHEAIFRFCAIPQAMAIATLSKVYSNPDVFTSNVKIRKGLTAKIMVDIVDADALWEFMLDQLLKLEKKGLNSLALGYLADARGAITAEKATRISEPYRQVS